MNASSMDKKSYNGVAILSKIKISNIQKGYIKDQLNQSRIISGVIKLKKDIVLINVYVPNGNPIDTPKYDYKKNWLLNFNSDINKKILKKKFNHSRRF